MKGLVVYKGKYGSTKQYAQWIAEALGFEVISVEHVKEKPLEDYAYIVVGGSIYIGKIKIAEWLINHWEALKPKKVYFFSVGDMQASDTAKVKSVWSTNLPEEILSAIKCKHFSGRSCFREMGWLDKFLVFAAAMKTQDKNIRTKMFGESDQMSKESALAFVEEIKVGLDRAGEIGCGSKPI
jgi:menaquinone-dependent protoporphyrinogen IX oxidase